MPEAGHLLADSDVPALFRVPFVQSGYRAPGQPWSAYLRSAFRANNEVGNVWTHLLPALLLVLEVARFQRDFGSLAPFDAAMVTVFGAAAVGVDLVSSAAHLLHSRSPGAHLVLYCADYAGIGVYGFAYSLCGFCVYARPAYFTALRRLAVPATALLSLVMSAALIFVLASRRRRLPRRVFALMLLPAVVFFVFGVGPVFDKVYALAWRRQPAVDFQAHHLVHAALLMLALFLYVSRVPERWAPGWFDLVGNSHQLFHLVTAASQLAVIRGVRVDMESPGTVRCSQKTPPLPPGDLLLAQLLLVVVNAGLVLGLFWRYHRKAE